MPMPPPGSISRVAKASLAMADNVRSLLAQATLDCVAFVTLTFKSGPDDPANNAREAQRRFRRFIRLWVLHRRENTPPGTPILWAAVLERSRRGRLHYHVLVDAGVPLGRASFDWAAYALAKSSRSLQGRIASTRAYGRSATPALRALWGTIRDLAERSGFGRSEALPLRSNDEAVAIYLAKYLAKHDATRLSCDARVKRSLFSPGVRRTTQNFAWHSPGAQAWRASTADLATHHGVESWGTMYDKFKAAMFSHPNFAHWTTKDIVQLAAERASAQGLSAVLGPHWAFIAATALYNDAQARLEFWRANQTWRST